MVNDGTHANSVNRELIIEFFLTFSRFEFALKNAGIYKRHKKDKYDAEPDWDTFASIINKSLNNSSNERLRAACRSILAAPPRKQVVSNGSLGWDFALIDSGSLDIAKVLVYVRRIRNNLFHGGKCESASSLGVKRNTGLLNDALVVLLGCLELSIEVKREYDLAVF